MPECQNCGEFVTDQYARVFAHPRSTACASARTVRTSSGETDRSARRTRPVTPAAERISAVAPYRLGLTATYKRADNAHELLEDTGLVGPVVYEEEVDAEFVVE